VRDVIRGTYLALIVGVALLSGCTKATDAANPDAAPSATPATAKVVDMDSAKKGSAEQTVLGLLRYMQLGTTTLAVDLYHPDVLREFSPQTVSDALASQAKSVKDSQVKDLTSESTRRGRLVTLLLAGDAATTRYSFVLRRSDGRWAVIYDTLLEGGLGYVAQAEVVAETKKPATDPRALAAADRAAQRYRSLSLDSACEGTDCDEEKAAPGAKPSPTPTPTPSG
jgi:hypothetical protein